MRDYSRNYSPNILEYKRAPNPYWKIIMAIFLTSSVAALIFFNRKPHNNNMVVSELDTKVTIAIPTSMASLIDLIEKEIEENSGTYSVYIFDLKKGKEIGIREKTIYTAASINKIPILAALYYLVNQGKIDLEKKITLQPQDIQDYGTGSIRYDKVGTSYSIKTITRLMMEKSDNTAAYLLGTIVIGIDKIQELVDSWKLTQTDMINNKTSNYDMARIMTKMYKGEIASKALTSEMLDFMRKSDFDDRLPAELPEGTKIYHKTGDEVGAIHDVGIIEVSGKPYYLGILTTDILDEVKTKKTMSHISKLVYEYMKKRS